MDLKSTVPQGTASSNLAPSALAQNFGQVLPAGGGSASGASLRLVRPSAEKTGGPKALVGSQP